MRLFNRCRDVNHKFVGDAAGCMVVFAVDIARRMVELLGTSLQCGRRTSLSQRCNP